MATTDALGNIHDTLGRFDGHIRTEQEGALTAPAAPPIGETLEKISAAEARRLLPEGQRVQVLYVQRGKLTDGGDPILRTIAKQSPHQMVHISDTDDRGSHLRWEGMTASLDESTGAVVINDDEGVPMVAYLPLASDADAIDDPRIALRVLNDMETAKATDRPAVLDELAGSEVTGIRRAVAANPHTTAATLTFLAEHARDEKTQELIVRHPNLDRPALDHLSASEHKSVRYQVACHPAADAHILAPLALDKEGSVRCAAARNANATPAMLERLSGDNDPDVRAAVAGNLKTRPELLDKLSRGHGMVMAQVAKNPSTPAETLHRLFQDTSTGNQMRALVAGNASAPADLRSAAVNDADDWVREHAAGNAALTETELPRLVRDSSQRVRRALARNRAAGAVLPELGRDADDFVRSTAAKNPAASPELLRSLAADEFHAVRAGVASNPNTPRDVLERLVDDLNHIGMAARSALNSRPQAEG